MMKSSWSTTTQSRSREVEFGLMAHAKSRITLPSIGAFKKASSDQPAEKPKRQLPTRTYRKMRK